MSDILLLDTVILLPREIVMPLAEFEIRLLEITILFELSDKITGLPKLVPVIANPSTTAFSDLIVMP